MTYRVSVSDIDAYRYWRDNDQPVEALRARLLRTEPASPEMRAGTLLHSVLQHEQDGELFEVEGDGLVLRFQLDAEIVLPEIREQFIRRVYEVDGGLVEMRGKVDGMQGLTVEDHKTTKNFDPEALHEAMQWRFYLSMTGAQRFRWNVFEMYEPTKAEPNVHRVVNLHRVEQWRYPSMEADCLAALSEFLGVVRRAVPDYGKPKEKAA